MNLTRTSTPAEASSASTEPVGFLSRWSRRKLGQISDEPAEGVVKPASVPEVARRVSVAGDAVQPEVQALAGQTAVEAASAEAPVEAIDPRTGKPYSELTDEDMPDIESLTEDSDLRGFMSAKVSEALRMKALSKVFHSPKYNKVCLCAEYADDYTNFLPMGDIVPHDLKSAIAREAGKLVKRLAEQGLLMTPEQAEAHAASEFRGEKPELPELPPLEPLEPQSASADIKVNALGDVLPVAGTEAETVHVQQAMAAADATIQRENT